MRLVPRPTRLMIVYGMIVLGLLMIPIVWFIFHTLFWLVQPVSSNLAETMGTNSTEYYQVDAFFQGIDNYAHIIALMVLALFGFVYSQRRGKPVYG